MIFCVMVIGSGFVSAQGNSDSDGYVNALQLTKQERAWLETSPIIELFVPTNLEPYSYVDLMGEVSGVTVDFVRELEKKLGIKFKVKSVHDSELIRSMENNKVQAVSYFIKPASASGYLSSSSYASIDLGLFVKKGTVQKPFSFDSFTGKKIAMYEGVDPAWIQIDELQNNQIVYYKTVKEGLKAVLTGEVDAWFDAYQTATYFIHRDYLHELEAVYIDSDVSAMQFYITEDNPELLSILNKAINAMTIREREQLLAPWGGGSAVSESEKVEMPALSEQQKLWLKDHPVIRVGVDPDYAPYEFINRSHKHRGISSDYLTILSRLLGVKFEVMKELNWQQVMDGARSRKIDLLVAATATHDRQQFLKFTEPYIQYQIAIVNRINDQQLTGLKSLAGKSVALVKDYAFTELVIAQQPDIKPVYVDTVLEGLKAVAANNAVAMVSDLGSMVYKIREYSLSNLHVARFLDLKAKGLAMGVRDDWPELAEILDLALKSIPESYQHEILNRWIGEQQEATIDDEKVNLPELTEGERAWLAAHPKITVGVMSDWPPMDFVDSRGQSKGIGAGFIEAINKRLGDVLQLVPGSWQEIYEGVKEKQIDAIAGITPRADREPYFNFTEPYIVVPHVIFTRKGVKRYGSLSDLHGMSVGVEKGFFIVKELRDNHPQVTVKEYPTTRDALYALSTAEVDAYVGNRAVALFTIERELIPSIEEHARIRETRSVNAIGVRKDWPELHTILEKTLRTISDEERREILGGWVEPSIEDRFRVRLTPEEQQWVDQHSYIRLGYDPDYPPVEFVDDTGAYAGIGSDYVRLIERRLGVKIEAVPNIRSWSEALEMVKAHEVDALPLLTPSSARSEYLVFSKPYLQYSNVVITRDNYAFITGLGDLAGKQVAVLRGQYSQEVIERDYPDIKSVPMESIAEALKAVATGGADAFVNDSITSAYYIRKNNIPNLKFAAAAEFQNSGYAFGVRHDWPELAAILNKVFDDIREEEHLSISNKWLNVKYEAVTDYTLVWKVVAAFIVIVLLVLLWNYKIRQQKLLAQAARDEAEAARQELEEANQKMQAIFDSASAGIAMIRGRTITSCNRRMDEMYGCEPGEQEGQSTRIWYPDDETYERIGQEVYAQIARDETHVSEIQAVKKDGSRFWARASVHAIDHHDLSKGLVAVIDDITQERLMIDEMRETQKSLRIANVKLKQLDKLKSMFIASMSHELRTPLNSIIGFSGLLLQGVSGDISDEQRDDINRIYKSGKHLLELITDVIDISKIEAGRIDSFPQDILLDDLVYEAVETVRPQLEQKDLELKLDIEEGIQMHTDRKRVMQCLLNLMSNAVKYTETGSVTVQAFSSGDEVTVSVADTGIGIPEEDLPKLFEAFERLDSHLRVKAGGTGLGLYLTKKIITDILNGNIAVESQEGVGSIFTMTAARYIDGSRGE